MSLELVVVTPEGQAFSDAVDQVVLPGSQRQVLESVLQRYDSGTRKVLQDWGILGAGTPGPDRVTAHLAPRGGLRLLFCGPSGTGKTLCAEALAQRLGRRLLVTDMSRLLSKWICRTTAS